jgi:hypothetical protein
MDRAGYLEALRAFAGPLREPTVAPDPERDAYVARIVAMGSKLRASEGNEENDGVEAFRHVLMPNVRDIMWRVAGATLERRRQLGPESRDALRVLEVSPDLLGPLAYARTEVAHSRALSFFLDPAQSGDVGRECLAAFVELVARVGDRDADDEAPDVTGAHVMAERVVAPYGRVDVSIDAPKSLIFVEVKVDAAEGPSQLARYNKALAQLAMGREALLVFLTADDEQTGAGSDHRHVTFADVLRAWLPIAARTKKAQGTYLAMYLKTIARHLHRLADDGEFDAWRLPTQRAALAFIERELET